VGQRQRSSDRRVARSSQSVLGPARSEICPEAHRRLDHIGSILQPSLLWRSGRYLSACSSWRVSFAVLSLRARALLASAILAFQLRPFSLSFPQFIGFWRLWGVFPLNGRLSIRSEPIGPVALDHIANGGYSPATACGSSSSVRGCHGNDEFGSSSPFSTRSPLMIISFCLFASVWLRSSASPHLIDVPLTGLALVPCTLFANRDGIKNPDIVCRRVFILRYADNRGMVRPGKQRWFAGDGPWTDPGTDADTGDQRRSARRRAVRMAR